MLSAALQFWEAISGKVKQLIKGEMKNVFRCERYDVTTAPNGTTIGVTLPLGSKEIFLPYSAEVANATVGTPVLVVWWGSMSNAKVYYYANGYNPSTANINAVAKTGDTMTGTLNLRSDNITSGTAPAAATYGRAVDFRDRASTLLGTVQPYQTTADEILMQMYARKYINGNAVSNALVLGVAANGTRRVLISEHTQWLNALNALGNRGDISTAPATDTAILQLQPGVYRFGFDSQPAYLPTRYGVLELLVAGAYGIARITAVNNAQALVWERAFNASTKTWYQNETTWKLMTDLDSGWQTATLTSSFVTYSGQAAPAYRKIGNVVYLRGAIAPAATWNSSTETTIFTLPSGYRPATNMYSLCQGSTMAHWLLIINASNGNVNAQRYGDGTSFNTAVPTSVWMPFSGVSFPVG